jgi:hypothetical protein
MKETRNRNQKIEKKKKNRKGPREPLGPVTGNSPWPRRPSFRTGILLFFLIELTCGPYVSASSFSSHSLESRPETESSLL